MNQNHQVYDLANALKGLLARFANKDGVDIKFHKTEPKLKIEFMTEDKFVIRLDYDINETSKEYINNMLSSLITNLEGKRKERHDSPIILLA